MTRFRLISWLGVGLALATLSPTFPESSAAGSKTASKDVQPEDPLPEGALTRLGSIRFRLEQNSYAIAISPDGKTIASAGNSRDLVLLDSTTGKVTRRVNTDSTGIGSLQFSPDGKTLAAITHHNQVQLYNAATGDSIRQIALVNGQAGSIAFSADGKMIACGIQNYGKKTPTRLWDVTTGKELGAFDAIQNMIVNVALSGDGRFLATFGQHNETIPGAGRNKAPSQTVQIWDVAKGKELRQIKDEDLYSITSADFSPDGKHLALTGFNGSTLSIYEVETGKRVRRHATRLGTNALLRYSADGKMLAAATHKGVIQLWDTATGKRLCLCEGPQYTNLAIAFLKDGKAKAVGVNGQSVCVWEVPSGKVLSPVGGHTSSVLKIRFSPNGKELISASSDVVCFWDLATGKEARRFTLKGDDDAMSNGGFKASQFIISPDGKYLLAGGQGMGLHLFDLATQQALFDLPGSFQANEMSAAFAPDSTTLAFMSISQFGPTVDGTIKIWNLSTGEEIRQLQWRQVSTTQAKFTFDGKTLYAAMSYFPTPNNNTRVSELIAWNVTTGKEVWKKARPLVFMEGMSVSPDGSLLATAGRNQGVLLWDAASGKQLKPFEQAEKGVPYLATSNLAFSPDGRTLTAATFDQQASVSKIQIYETASGGMRKEFKGPTSPINVLAFSPDGRTLASGNNDTTILLWNLSGKPTQEDAKTIELAAHEIDTLWEDLNTPDAVKGHQAMLKLASDPKKTVAYLEKHIHPAEGKTLDAKAISQLINNLESDEFKTREDSSRDLEQAGPIAKEALEKALKAAPTEEKQRRIEAILANLAKTGPSQEMLRPTRSLEVLERLGTLEARDFLKTLAKGNADAKLTQEAKAALQRLAK